MRTALTQLAAGKPNSGDWDMITVNETGAHKGRYLFTVFESGQSGVQRHDLLTGETDTIWHSPVAGGHVSFDPSYLDALGHVHHRRGKLVRRRGGMHVQPIRPPVRAARTRSTRRGSSTR